MRLAYLFSRYPIVSQTFCDTEILALERMGVKLELYSVYPPPTSIRHGHATQMEAEIVYAPPSEILKRGEAEAKKAGRWPAEFIAEQERKYGPEYKSELRARNALYFADLFKARGITHFHVHFANRAAHTALFLKKISGLPYSISTHGQDFMVDLGSDDLLREICAEAEFIANETEYSKGLVAGICPESAGKMHRVFNGMNLENFPAPTSTTCNPIPRIVSIGRLIEFKGFHHLIAACSKLKWRGVAFQCDIIGEGPWRGQLQEQIEELDLVDCVRLTGSLPQEEVFMALRSCDIFTLACIVDKNGASDVFPTVILEAMASAKPVVSTVLAGVPEQIMNGRTGSLVPPGDETALAEALEQFLISADRRRLYGQAARDRLEREFAVEKTVLPLKALFEQYVKPAAPVEKSAAGLASLVLEWPPSEGQATELQAIAAAVPSSRIYAIRVGSAGAEGNPLMARTQFLPDGMVLEGEWQQERELARQMETWRAELGQKLSSELFLTHARYALYLRQWIKREGIQKVHASSDAELLVAWLLNRLCGVKISATLRAKTTLPASVVLQLTKRCSALRFAEKSPGLQDQAAKTAPGAWILPAPSGFRAKGNEKELAAKLAEIE